MIKIIYRTILTLITIFLFFVLYLSTVGIKTDKLNNEISKKIKNINNNFEIELKEVSIILNPLELTFLLKTLGTDLSYKNKLVQLETIKSKISIKSLLNNQFSLNHINISTKSVDIKSLISFIRVINNDPKLTDKLNALVELTSNKTFEIWNLMVQSKECTGEVYIIKKEEMV